MKDYKRYSVTTVPFNPDLLSGILWELEIKGIEEMDTCLFVYSDADSQEIGNEIDALLLSMRNQNLIESFQVDSEQFENKNWNEEWEKKFDIIKVTDRIVIRPAFKEYIKSGNEIVITIIPKMSFGTGEHETTRLVIQMLDKYVKPGDKVLDIGSGTAILAITSVKLGAGSAIGIDNDEWCLLNGKENTGLNDLDSKVDVRLCELCDINENEFDLIAANINKNVLIDIAEGIAGKIKKGGTLILSGLLIEDINQLVPLYKKSGFVLTETGQQNEWAALVLTME